jgi:predicted RNA-binding protein with PIN domain
VEAVDALARFGLSPDRQHEREDELAVIIDGYNFLFADRRDMLKLAPGELERMRREFLGRLARLAAVENTAITVVFDGGEDAEAFVRETTWHGVKVVFSDKSGSADAEILRLLEEGHAARDTVVVSNDNELRRGTKRLGAHVTSVEEFKRHMKETFKGQRQAHREPLEKYEGVPQSDVEYWMKQFGVKDPESDPPKGDSRV